MPSFLPDPLLVCTPSALRMPALICVLACYLAE
jgi:hypothetical protein